MITSAGYGWYGGLYSIVNCVRSITMATLQFQREQLSKELCVIELKLQALRKNGVCDLNVLRQLQDSQQRHQQLLEMIDHHLKLSMSSVPKK